MVTIILQKYYINVLFLDGQGKGLGQVREERLLNSHNSPFLYIKPYKHDYTNFVNTVYCVIGLSLGLFGYELSVE